MDTELDGFCVAEDGFIYHVRAIISDDGIAYKVNEEYMDMYDSDEENTEYLGGKIFTKKEVFEDKIVLSDPIDLNQYCE